MKEVDNGEKWIVGLLIVMFLLVFPVIASQYGKSVDIYAARAGAGIRIVEGTMTVGVLDLLLVFSVWLWIVGLVLYALRKTSCRG